MNTPTEKRQDVEAFWNAKPCDSDRSDKSYGSKDYFIEIEEDRYKYQHHILDILNKIDWRGKKVLEIGTGVGTDARVIIARGADYTGINIDKGSVELTQAALAAFSLTGKVDKCDATSMPYGDATFDIVYSFGALPCIPDLGKAIGEIYRVLKPGGHVVALLYNRSSINYHVEIMFLRKTFRHVLRIPGAVWGLQLLGLPRDRLEGHLKLYREKRSMSDEEWLSRNTDGPENPFICVQDSNEAKSHFRRFKNVSQEVYFFDFRHWGVLGRLLPRAVVHFLGKRWGWHRIVHAKKVLEGQ